MMEFLDKIYGYEHFGIILFAVIAVLVVLFMIILFFGKRDEKKREIERTQKLAAEELQNNMATDAFKETEVPSQAVEVTASTIPPIENAFAFPISSKSVEEPAVESEVSNAEETPIVNHLDLQPKIPVFEPVIPSTPEVAIIESDPATPKINTSVVAPVLEPTIAPTLVTQPVAPEVAPVMPKEAVVEPEIKLATQSVTGDNELPEIEIPEFNFDELAASIASELSQIEKSKPIEPVAPAVPEASVVPVEPVQAPVTPIEEIVKPVANPRPQVFSSVYINKPVAPIEEVKVVEPVVPVAPVAPVTPIKPEPVVKPSLDLPKPAEMPILNKEVNTAVNEVQNVIPDFSQFEGESYDIK